MLVDEFVFVVNCVVLFGEVVCDVMLMLFLCGDMDDIVEKLMELIENCVSMLLCDDLFVYELVGVLYYDYYIFMYLMNVFFYVVMLVKVFGILDELEFF